MFHKTKYKMVAMVMIRKLEVREELASSISLRT